LNFDNEIHGFGASGHGLNHTTFPALHLMGFPKIGGRGNDHALGVVPLDAVAKGDAMVALVFNANLDLEVIATDYGLADIQNLDFTSQGSIGDDAFISDVVGLSVGRSTFYGVNILGLAPGGKRKGGQSGN